MSLSDILSPWQYSFKFQWGYSPILQKKKKNNNDTNLAILSLDIHGISIWNKIPGFSWNFQCCLGHIINIKYFGNLLSYSVGLKYFHIPKKVLKRDGSPDIKLTLNNIFEYTISAKIKIIWKVCSHTKEIELPVFNHRFLDNRLV